jgi:hypothetical protein
MGIVERRGERFGLAQVGQHTLKIVEIAEC